MKIRIIFISFLLLFFLIIKIIYNNNYFKNNEIEKVKLETNFLKNEQFNSASFISQESKPIKYKVSDRNNDINKRKFNRIFMNEQDFINYISQKTKTESEIYSNYFFVIGVVAIDIQTIHSPTPNNVLWYDDFNIFVESATSYYDFDPEKGILLFNKNSNKVFITNGVFTVKYIADLLDLESIEKKFNVKIIYTFKDDNIIAIRANHGSNLLQIYHLLKSDNRFQSVTIETQKYMNFQ